MLSNKTYDILKKVVEIGLPALATLYLTLGDIWDLPKRVEVAATITALAAFGGVFLLISNNAYQKVANIPDGSVHINLHDPEEQTLGVEFHKDISELEGQDTVRLKVVK